MSTGSPSPASSPGAGGEAAFFVGIWGKASFEFNATPTELAWVMAALGVASLIGSAGAGLAVDRLGPRQGADPRRAGVHPGGAGGDPGDLDHRALPILVFFTGLLSAPVYTAVASMAPFPDIRPGPALIHQQSDRDRNLGSVHRRPRGRSAAGRHGLTRFDLRARCRHLPDRGPARPPYQVAATGRTGTNDSGFFAELVSGIRYSASRPALRFMLVAGTSVWLAYGAFNSLEPLFYREVLNTGPAALGLDELAVRGGDGGRDCAGPLGSPRSGGGRRLYPVLVALNGAAGLIYVSTDRLGVVAIGAFCWGSVIGILSPVYRTLVQSVTPDHLMGRVQGASQMLSDTLRLGAAALRSRPGGRLRHPGSPHRQRGHPRIARARFDPVVAQIR